MTAPSPRARRADAVPPAVVASVLVEAQRAGDAAVVERYGYSRSAIRAWRARVATDPELARLVHAREIELASQWAEAVSGVVCACARRAERIIESPTPLDKAALDELRGINQTMKSFGDIVLQNKAIHRAAPPTATRAPGAPGRLDS